MKLLTHRDIPAATLRPLQKAVNDVESAQTALDNAQAELTAALKQVPSEAHKPANDSKLKTWQHMRDARCEQVGFCEQAVASAFEKLCKRNGILGKAVETFRIFAGRLLAEGEGKAEGARRAAMNVLASDRLYAATDDAIAAERAKKPQPSLFDRLILQHLYLASQRHYTVRFRFAAQWTYCHDRSGFIKKPGQPEAPCMTFGEAERYCVELGQKLGQRTSMMAFEVQVFNLVKQTSCGTSVTCSPGQLPKATD